MLRVLSVLLLPVSLAVLLCCARPALAQVPEQLAYQGVLTTETGQAVPDGSYQITYRLYDQSEGGQARWTEIQTLPVSDGLFSAVLGQENPLRLPFDRAYWLTVEIEGEPESGRMALSAAAYALVARDVVDSTVVRSISGLRDDIDLVAGDGISIRQQGNRLIISAQQRGLQGYGPAETPVAAGKAGADLTEAEDDARLQEWTATLGPGGSNTGLDAAYDAGRIITLDDGQISINRPGTGFAAQSGILMRNGDIRLRDDQSATNISYRLENATQDWRMNLDASEALKFVNATSGTTPFQVLKNATNSLLSLSGSTVKVTGQVGTAALHVNGTSWFQGDATPLPAGAGAGIAMGYLPLYDGGYIFSYDYGTMSPRNLLLNHAGGNVGIGTLSPTAKLHVEGGDVAGVYGQSTSNAGVYGLSSNYVGVIGQSSNSTGVFGTSPNGHGVSGFSTSNVGVYGTSSSSYGVYGQSSSDFGVYGTSTSNAGVRGSSGSYFGVYGTSTSSYGIYGSSTTTLGIFGSSASTGSAGIYGQSPYIGVEGITTNSSDPNRQGVRGDNFGSATGWAGYFYGNVGVSGSLSKGAGSFKIDHPLDPENKYLYHSFVESPDMMNVYNGNAVLDARGEAVVALPEYFEALNRDFRYQLTCIGGFAPVYIAEKVQGNRFKIAGGEAGMEVSWQVTGIRHDAYAEQHRIPVEEMKPSEERGRYLHPAAFGLPMERSVEALRSVPEPPKPPSVEQQEH